MIPVALVSTAIAVQLATVVRAALFLRGTEDRHPWTFFMAGFTLMLVATAIHFTRLVLGTVTPGSFPGMEVAMVVITCLLALGVYFLPPSLLAIRRSETLEANLGTLLDNSLHELLVLDPKTQRFLLGNRGIQEGLGYSLEELKEMGPLDVDPSLDSAKLKELLKPLLSGDRVRFRRRTQQRKKDGTLRPVEVHLRKGTFENQDVVIIMVLDLTERMEAEARATGIQDRLEEAQRMAHVATWEWDLKTNEIHWSEELFRIFGLEPGSFTPRFDQIIEVMAPECRDRMRKLVQNALQEKKGFDAQYGVIHPSGERREVQVWARMDLDEDGEPLRILGVSQDITTLKETEAALRASEARLRTVIEHAPVVLFAVDADGFFTMSEGRGLAVLGLKPGEVVGSHVEEVYGDNPQILSDVRRVLKGEAVADRVRAGSMVFETRYTPLEAADGEIMGAIGVATDVTEVSQIQDEQRKLAALVERSKDFIGLASLEGEVLYLNPAGLEMCGVESLEKARGMHIREWAADEPEIEEVMKALRTEGYWAQETELKHLVTGEIIPVSTQVFLVTAPQTLEPLAIATVMRNLREEKAAMAEKERIESLLRQSQKMETIGTLAGGIAHDFNNLLTPILGWSQLIREDLGEDHPAQADLQEVEDAAVRAKELVRQILSFSRQGEQERTPLDPSPVAAEATRLLRATLPSSIEIRSNIREECGLIRADPTQIHQVVMNLGANALHAMKGRKGILGIELGEVVVDEDFAELRPNLEPGPHIRITVSDTGIGMDARTQERVMEPFFTTKAVGEGTGLGLSVVHGIVTSYRGDITIYSEPGRGTSVSIYIPVVPGTTPAPDTHEVKPPRKTGARVLVVDDQPEILTLAKRMLSGLGYRPLTAEGSQEALSRIRRAPQSVDLLVTDFTMPGMNGLELIREVKEIRPDLPVVLASGFSETITAHRLQSEGIPAYLTKPFVSQELEEALRKAWKTED